MNMLVDYVARCDSKGYEVVPGIEARPQTRGARLLTGQLRGPSIRARGGRIVERRPFENPKLYKQFINQCRTPEGVALFMTWNGALGIGPGVKGIWLPGPIIEVAAQLRGVVDLIAAGTAPQDLWEAETEVAKLSAFLQPPASPNERPRLALRPMTLISGIKLQLLQDLVTTSELRTCRQCGDVFEVGPGTQPRRSRKSEFCSGRCRSTFHNQRRARAGS